MMIGHGFTDRVGRQVTLCPVTADNWRAVADVAPRDDQRAYVAALGARYLLLSTYEDVWHSLAVCADEQVVGHIMWGRDDDGSCWIGGMLIDAAEQGRGVGRAAVQVLASWLAEQDGCRAVRLSYHPGNVAARQLYESVGFVPTGLVEDGEIVAELARHVSVHEADLPKAEFGFPGPLRDKLVAAILSGEKTSTTGLEIEHRRGLEPAPQVGTRCVIVDSADRPVGIMETTEVRRVRLGDVDLAHAVDEGEGYETVAQWRAAHERFWHGEEFRAYLGDPGFTVDDDTIVVAERFRLVRRLPGGD
jgi:diamine N-acetyltransferase